MLSPRPWTYGITMCPLVGLPPGVLDAWLLLLVPLVPCAVLPTWLLPFSSQFPFITLFWTLLMAHLGYLHLASASLRCCSSSFRSSGVVQTDLALWVSVPMTLYLAASLWWLSHCKYWSVCVGLQYTLMLRELSASGMTQGIKKWNSPIFPDYLWQDNFTRLIKESIFIRVNNPTLNRNIGKFQLSHIWDRVLFGTPNIKVANPKGNVQHSP